MKLKHSLLLCVLGLAISTAIAGPFNFPASGGGSSNVSNLDSISDVDVSTAVANNVLIKRGDGTWVGGPASGSGDGTGNWTASGSDSYQNTGKVGIGTTAPSVSLEVNGDILSNSLGIGATATSRAVRVTNLFSDYAELLQAPTNYTYTTLAGKTLITSSTDTIFWMVNGSTTPSMTLLNGRLGIGTTATNTNYLLDVAGNIRGQNAVFTSTYSTGGYFQYLGSNNKWNYVGIPGVGVKVNSFGFDVSTAAGNTATVFTVSTGTIELFRVTGTSVAIKVPLYFPDGSVQTTSAPASIAVSQLSATGTPDNTTFLRGDNSWQVPGGSGDMVLATTQTVSAGKVFTSFLTLNGSTLTVAGATGATANQVVVSTGGVPLFQVSGTSVSLKVPMSLGGNDLTNVGGVYGPTGSNGVITVNGNFTTTGTATAVNYAGSAATLNVGPSGNTAQEVFGATHTTVSSNWKSTGTATAVGFFGTGTTLQVGPSGNTNALFFGSTTTTVSSNLKSTGTAVASNITSEPVLFSIDLSSDTLAAGCTIWLGDAPSYSSLTITKVVAKTYSVAASSANYSLQNKPTGTNGSDQAANGTQIFTGTYSTATWSGGSSITSFNDNSIAANEGVYFVTKDGGSTSGTPRHLSVKIYGKYDNP